MMVCTRAEPWDMAAVPAAVSCPLCSVSSAWLTGITACPDNATGHVCLFIMLCWSPATSAYGPLYHAHSLACLLISKLKCKPCACCWLLEGLGVSPWPEEPLNEQSFGLGMTVMGWKVPLWQS